MKRFGVWNGVTINPAYRSLAEIRDAVLALKPEGSWSPEWIVKAGEGGSWQATWDPHPLAVDGFGKLLALVEQGKRLRPRLMVTPYVVIRGRPEWRDAELKQIAECAVASRRVVLNLEEGDHYWNGPTEPDDLLLDYLLPMWDRIQAAYGADPAWRKVQIELAAIPRRWVLDELGGLATFEKWAKCVNGISWECYDAIARDLDVADSMDRVRQWLRSVGGPWRRLSFYVPIVQRSRIAAWAATPYARPGLEVWHLDGD